jgi:nitrogenase molybdenum-iron protein alpha chain
MFDIKSNQCGTRESRLGSFVGYSGSLHEIGQQVCGGCTQEKKRCFSQASGCPSGCALGQLSGINDAAIVHHGPSGCAGTAIGIASTYELLSEALGKKREHFAYTCTDMTESDTVFGSTDNLKDVVLETYRRYHPKAIFIGASCVSGIIGEDLEGILDDLKDEIPVPIAPVHCEGFKSQIWATGFDVAQHAILKYIVKPPQKKTNKVNLIGFARGTAWNACTDLKRLFDIIGVEPTYLLTLSTVEELEHLSEAAATIVTCGTLGNYLAHGLESEYGVPYIRSLQPHGIIGFEDWSRQLAKITGKEAEVEKYLQEEKDIYQPQIDKVKDKLKGKRAMIAMGPGFGSYYSRIVQEFGMELTHISSWHFDKQYEDGQQPVAFKYLVDNSPDIPFSVNDLQNYEYMNILDKIKPDIFLTRHPGSTVWAMKIGTPSYCVYDEYTALGYKGMLRFGNLMLDIITNRSFTENLSKRIRLPYTQWWLQQKPDSLLIED